MLMDEDSQTMQSSIDKSTIVDTPANVSWVPSIDRLIVPPRVESIIAHEKRRLIGIDGLTYICTTSSCYCWAPNPITTMQGVQQVGVDTQIAAFVFWGSGHAQLHWNPNDLL